jgi:hypothetical protein
VNGFQRHGRGHVHPPLATLSELSATRHPPRQSSADPARAHERRPRRCRRRMTAVVHRHPSSTIPRNVLRWVEGGGVRAQGGSSAHGDSPSCFVFWKACLRTALTGLLIQHGMCPRKCCRSMHSLFFLIGVPETQGPVPPHSPSTGSCTYSGNGPPSLPGQWCTVI